MNRALIQLSETHYLKCVVILLPLMNFLSGVSTDLYAPSLPALASYFHVSVTVVKNSVTTTLLGFALGALIFGLLMDVYGRKKVIVLTVIAFTLVSFYAPFCRNIAELLIIRLLQGMTISTVAIGSRALAVDYFSGRRFFVVVMYTSLGYGLGTILGPVIGGYLQYHFGWRANFYAYAVIGVFIVGCMLLFLNESVVKTEQRSVVAALKSYGRVICHPMFIAGETIIAIIQIEMYIYPTIASFLVQNHLGYSSVVYGNSALFVGLSYLVGTLANRLLLKYFVPRQLVLGGFVLFTFALFCQLILAEEMGMTLLSLVVPICLINLAFGFIFANILGTCLQLFRDSAGVALAVHVCMLMLFSSVGIFIISGFHISHLLSLFFVYLLLLLLQVVLLFSCFIKKLV
ncbi:MAG: multidrug effflux MFS transporter [Gammaproteobacteria bacterium]|nr:multidrug effflux MFS transporter [Gammaproteobacteria bacterium]